MAIAYKMTTCNITGTSTMSNKLTITLAAAATTLLMAGSANAVVIDFAHTWDGDNVPTSSVSGANVNSFNSGVSDWSGSDPVSSSTLNPFNVVTGSVSGQYAAPHITDGSAAGTDDPTPYYTVPRVEGSDSLTLEFGDAYNYFGLFWGSIDDYNTIEFLLDGLSVASFDGNGVTNPADGNQQAPSTNTYVNFSDLTYDEVRFSSSQFAFEFDNIAVAQVPEPAALGMFGVGLLGLGLTYRRRKAA